jgi:hypothetical protein
MSPSSGLADPVQLVVVQVAAPSAVSGGKPCATEAAGLTPEEVSALEDAPLGLIVLGYRKADASPRAKRALDSLKKRGDRITSETLLEAALR